MRSERVVLLISVALAMALTRPCASAFPTWVERRRANKKHSTGGWRQELKPMIDALKRADGARAWSAIRHKCSVGSHEWPDESWALDAGLVSYGCALSRKGRQTCFVGAAGGWHTVPSSWKPAWDRYALIALHALACACANFDPLTYYRHFEPRASKPHSAILGAFGTSAPLHLMWLAATILGVGADVQA